MRILLCLAVAVLFSFGFGVYRNGSRSNVMNTGASGVEKNAVGADFSNADKSTIASDIYIIDESEVAAFLEKGNYTYENPPPLHYVDGVSGGHYVVSPNPLTYDDIEALGIADETPATMRIDVSQVDMPEGSDKITCIDAYDADKNPIEVTIEDGNIITVPLEYRIPGYDIIGDNGDPIRLAMPVEENPRYLRRLEAEQQTKNQSDRADNLSDEEREKILEEYEAALDESEMSGSINKPEEDVIINNYLLLEEAYAGYDGEPQPTVLQGEVVIRGK